MICSSDGHKKYRSVYSRTYKGVKQKLMKFKVATVILQADPNETDVNHLSMTIEDLSQQWLSYVADHRKYPPTVNMRAFMRSTSKTLRYMDRGTSFRDDCVCFAERSVVQSLSEHLLCV